MGKEKSPKKETKKSKKGKSDSKPAEKKTTTKK